MLTIHNSQKVKYPKSINELFDKENVVHPDDGMLFSCGKAGSAAWMTHNANVTVCESGQVWKAT